MAFEQRSLDDYIDVAQRIADFREKYPEGVLRGSFDWTEDGAPFRIVQAQGFDKNGEIVQQTFIVYVALAYRTPDDICPGMGMAWEIFPGRTPYTRGSELQNAETSAWGRAIIAVGASDSKRGIASREEVRNRQAEREDGLPTNADGSLSRRGTTDEEKAAAGVMTARQQRKHAELAKPPANTQPVERVRPGDCPVCGVGLPQHAVGCTALVDDRWTSDAPSWLVGVDPPEDQPGSILPAQLKQIMAVYTALGKKTHPERMADIHQTLHITLSSTNDLSYQQAARLLENLHERHTGKMTRR